MQDKYFIADSNSELTNISMLFVSHHKEHTTEFTNGRDCETILFTTKGTVCYEAPDGSYKYDAPKGTIVYFPQGEKNKTSYIGNDSEVLGIRFKTSSGRLLDRHHIFEAGCSEAALSAAAQLASEFSDHREKDHAFFCSLVYELIHCLSEHLKESTPKKFCKLFPVMTELCNHPQHDRRVEDYARICGMSEVGFRRLFAEFTGMTPVEYRTKKRLELARDMLCSGEYSVSEISAKCGFNSVSFFCREYKKHFGYSAGQTGKTLCLK